MNVNLPINDGNYNYMDWIVSFCFDVDNEKARPYNLNITGHWHYLDTVMEPQPSLASGETFMLLQM